MPHSACTSAEIVVAISAGRRWRSISRQPGAVREHGNTGRAPLVVEAAEALAAAAALSLMRGGSSVGQCRSSVESVELSKEHGEARARGRRARRVRARSTARVRSEQGVDWPPQ